MENGTYLGGRHSSTQTSVIVPKPGSDYLYYIFTADGNESQRFGLSYSIVDMEQNDFDGKVIEKNVRLLDTITEHICAVRHKNKNHIWVITYHWKYNKFYSYLVTESSIEAPVISQGNLTCGRVTGCYLKPNSKGDKIVFANAEVDAYEIFDFDNSTGLLSNPIVLDNWNWTYCTEFSPNGRYLYATTVSPSKVLQFDLLAGDEVQINNSAILLASSSNFYYFGAIQIGLDGRIYISMLDQTYLGVLNNPDIRGDSCDFQHDGIWLQGSKCTFGLPNFINNFDKPEYKITIATNSPLCEGDSLYLEASEITGATYIWTGPDNFKAFTRVIAIKNVQKNNAGNYYVEATLENGTKVQATISIIIYSKPNVVISGDTLFCRGDSTELTATKNYEYTYLWSTGDRSHKTIVYKEGTYWVEVTNQNGCKTLVYYTVRYAENPIPSVNINNYSNRCIVDSVELETETGYTSYQWFDEEGNLLSSGSSKLNIEKEGKYYVKVKNKYGCEGISKLKEVSMLQDSNRLSFSLSSSNNTFFFDSTNILSMNCKDLTIKNNGDNTFILNDVYIFSNIHFSIPQSQFGIIIFPKQSVTLKICFSPYEIGLLRDTLIFGDRCEDHLIYLEGMCISNEYEGISKCETTVKLSTEKLNGDYLISYMSIFPNPADNELNFKISTDEVGVFNLFIFSINGFLIKEFSVNNFERKKIIEDKVELNNLSNGVYILLTQTPNSTILKSIFLKKD